jgi:hypothetical protein
MVANGAQRQLSESRSRPDKKDSKETAYTHWRALRDFLAPWMNNGELELR